MISLRRGPKIAEGGLAGRQDWFNKRHGTTAAKPATAAKKPAKSAAAEKTPTTKLAKVTEKIGEGGLKGRQDWFAKEHGTTR
jgi:hypothetical protein